MWFFNRFSDQSSTSGGPQKFHRRLDDGDGEISLDPQRRNEDGTIRGLRGPVKNAMEVIVSPGYPRLQPIFQLFAIIPGYI